MKWRKWAYSGITKRTKEFVKSLHYKEKELEQDGKCAICKELLANPHKDHCHSTLKFRGILCQNCNLGLGNFKDNQQYLYSAIEYLEKYK